MDFLPVPGFEPTTLGYLGSGFKPNALSIRPTTALFTVMLYIMRIYIMFNSFRVIRLFNVFEKSLILTKAAFMHSSKKTLKNSNTVKYYIFYI